MNGERSGPLSINPREGRPPDARPCDGDAQGPRRHPTESHRLPRNRSRYQIAGKLMRWIDSNPGDDGMAMSIAGEKLYLFAGRDSAEMPISGPSGGRPRAS